MRSQDPTSSTPPLPVSPELKRKPRLLFGTFWLVIAVILVIVGLAGTWWLVLVGVAAFAYSVYLYRGGRFGFLIF